MLSSLLQMILDEYQKIKGKIPAILLSLMSPILKKVCTYCLNVHQQFEQHQHLLIRSVSMDLKPSKA